MFKEIAEGKNPFEKKQMSADQAIYVQDSLAIGRSKYQDHAKFMSQFDIKMPSAHEIRNRKQRRGQKGAH